VAKHKSSQQLSLPDRRAGYAANLKKSGTRINEFLSPQNATPTHVVTAQGAESEAKTTVKLPKKNYITVLRKKNKTRKKESSPNISPLHRKRQWIMLNGFAAEPTG